MGQKCLLVRLQPEINRLRGSAGAMAAAVRDFAKMRGAAIARLFNGLGALQRPPSEINECFSFEPSGQFRVTENIRCLIVGHSWDIYVSSQSSGGPAIVGWSFSAQVERAGNGAAAAALRAWSDGN